MQVSDAEITTSEVRQWQGLHLLHFDHSSCSQKVRIVLRELRIDYTAHHINLMRGEQRSDWYLGINPRGLVPTLIHDGIVHIESNDIIQYLDQQFASAETSLMPKSDSTLEEQQALLDLEDDLHSDLRFVTFTYLAPDPGHVLDGSVHCFDVISRIHSAFAQLETALQSRPYLLGSRLTLADISWFITLYRLKSAGYPLSQHPHLAAYYARLCQRKILIEEVSIKPLIPRLVIATYRFVNRTFKHSLARDFARWQSQRTG